MLTESRGQGSAGPSSPLWLLPVVLVVLIATAGSVFRLYSIERHEAPLIKRSVAIDVNRADAPTLELLPMVGPGIAARIIAYRNEHGPFENVDQLIHVNRIGPVTLARIKPYVTCHATHQ